MLNDLKKSIVIAEIKINKKRIRMSDLKMKSEKLLLHYSEYTPELIALGLEDILEDYIEMLVKL